MVILAVIARVKHMKSAKQLTQHPYFKYIVIFLFFFFSLCTWVGFRIYGTYYLTTDNAYVNANVVQMSARVTGKVEKLYVRNNQYVKQGDRLFDIDAALFQSAVDSARAQVAVSEAELTKADITASRTIKLVNTHFVSPQAGDEVTANLKAAEAQVNFAKAKLQDALLNLSYTTITAPVNGWVTNLTLRDGDTVAAYQPLFALIDESEFWVDANFKETEMENLKPNQIADIYTDLYPDHLFHGYVETISGGTGSVFSLLPPQNATGNWVKVTQRIPVKVRITDPTSTYPLRIGQSATVTIHLRKYRH